LTDSYRLVEAVLRERDGARAARVTERASAGATVVLAEEKGERTEADEAGIVLLPDWRRF